MKVSKFLPLLLLLLCAAADAQRASQSTANTLEGYWQDTARRILYSRAAPPAYVYGEWTVIDQGQTYPAAKLVKRTGGSWDVIDLNFDDAEHVVRTTAATAQGIEFVRTVKWSGCAMRHQCALQGDEMMCALENVCPENGQRVVDWRGEERYARRISCERLGRVQLQGFPVSCR